MRTIKEIIKLPFLMITIIGLVGISLLVIFWQWLWNENE